jgi:hypothetical protein
VCVVRREKAGRSWGEPDERPARSCTTPAGERPVPVSAEAPDSRPQSLREIAVSRAGCQKPNAQQQLRCGERVRGPQHEVKPGASTQKQSESRAAHVTVKATTDVLVSERTADLGGVVGAARVQGEVRNTRDPSAQPMSRQRCSYKPKAKSSAVQRESEGIVVPKREAQAERTNAVKNNAAGGKDPCGGYVDGAAGKPCAGNRHARFERGPYRNGRRKASGKVGSTCAVATLAIGQQCVPV